MTGKSGEIIKLSVNGKEVAQSSTFREESTNSILAHALIPQLDLQNPLTVTLSEHSSDPKKLAGFELLINMPINVGCFEVFYIVNICSLANKSLINNNIGKKKKFRAFIWN